MNLPNKLTIFRMCMPPILIACFYLPWDFWNYIAAGIFVLAYITDIIDGAYARKHNIVTDFAIVGTCARLSLGISRTGSHLRIVGRQAVIEHQYGLVLSHRLLFGIEPARAFLLFPYPLIFEPIEVATSEYLVERALSKQDDRSTAFDDALVLRPKLVKRYDAVPLVSGRSVRQIADDGINGAIGYVFHPFEAVDVIYFVDFHILDFFVVVFPLRRKPLLPFRRENAPGVIAG